MLFRSDVEGSGGGAELPVDSMTDSERYRRKWALYRRLRNWFWALTLGSVPATYALVWGFRKLNMELTFAPLILIFIWAFVGIRLNYLECPRCGNAMFMRWPRQGFLQRKCVHCGLPKFAPNG